MQPIRLFSGMMSMKRFVLLRSRLGEHTSGPATPGTLIDSFAIAPSKIGTFGPRLTGLTSAPTPVMILTAVAAALPKGPEWTAMLYWEWSRPGVTRAPVKVFIGLRLSLRFLAHVLTSLRP
jgi:hypothetical protein